MPTAQQTAELKLWKRADDVLQANHPCNIHTLPDGRVGCAQGESKTVGVTWCCEDCEYVVPGVGCSIKSLGCKLEFCYYGYWNVPLAIRAHPSVLAVRELREEGMQAGLRVSRGRQPII